MYVTTSSFLVYCLCLLLGPHSWIFWWWMRECSSIDYLSSFHKQKTNIMPFQTTHDNIPGSTFLMLQKLTHTTQIDATVPLYVIILTTKFEATNSIVYCAGDRQAVVDLEFWKGGFQYAINTHKVPARGVWGHAPHENFGFLTFWGRFLCILGVKLQKVGWPTAKPDCCVWSLQN